MHPKATEKRFVTALGMGPLIHNIDLRDIVLPEFSRTKHINKVLTADVMHSPSCRYDVIVGRDFLKMLGMQFDFHHDCTTWDGVTVSMRDPDSFSDRNVLSSHLLDLYADDNAVGDNFLLDSKYEKVNLVQLVADQTHLAPAQREELLEVWKQCERLFSGELGKYPDKKVHLELKSDAVPKHHRPYAVPHSITPTFCKELERLVDIGVLARHGASEWAAPHFAIPKKDGRIRMISDFRSLNACIHRRVYPLPKIDDVLRRRSGYKYFTKLDISMQ